jgi:2-(1,2-epoxy-1,2-dihydrophenyl)acetyl-CoA isomerase
MAHLDLDITDGVATLTMNRPEARNALSMEMRAQLIEALHDIEHDDTGALCCAQGRRRSLYGGRRRKGYE